MALDRAVEIDQVQPFAAGIGEGLGLGGRAVVEHRGARHVAAQQAHALAVLEIDRRKQNHRGADLARRAAMRHPPASRMIFAHLAVSILMKSANSPGIEAVIVIPSCANLSCTSALRPAFTTAARSLLTMSPGHPPGPTGAL